jgi:hypothetical protein
MVPVRSLLGAARAVVVVVDDAVEAVVVDGGGGGGGGEVLRNFRHPSGTSQASDLFLHPLGGEPSISGTSGSLLKGTSCAGMQVLF